MSTFPAPRRPSIQPPWRRARPRARAALLAGALLVAAACAPPDSRSAPLPGPPPTAPATAAPTPTPGTPSAVPGTPGQERPSSTPGDSDAPEAPAPAPDRPQPSPSTATDQALPGAPAPPPVPDAAYDADPAGTFPVVEHFFATWAYAYETWDLEPFRDATTRGCEVCDDVASIVQGYMVDGTPSTGGAFTLTAPRQTVRNPGSIPGWRVVLDQDLLTLTYPGEDYTFSVPGMLGRVFVGLEWDGDRWRVALLEADESADGQAPSDAG